MTHTAQSAISFLNDVSRRLYAFGWIQNDAGTKDGACLYYTIRYMNSKHFGDVRMSAAISLSAVVKRLTGKYGLINFNDAPDRTLSEIFQALRYARRLIKAREKRQ